MTSTVRNRLLALGILWGLLLATVSALLTTNPYQLTGLLMAGLACAALSVCVGTLVASRRAAKKGAGRSLLAGVGSGALQGLVAALLVWVLMAVTISGFTLRNPVELSVLMSPRVFIGSFIVALSTFAYALVGRVLLGPIFGTLVNRTVRAGKNGAGEKEDLVVR